MLQIKTITDIETHSFDQEVNEALRDGWTLVKREIKPIAGVKTWEHILYAELEMVVITEAEKCCDNCAYSDASAQAEPCCRCEDASHWEAME